MSDSLNCLWGVLPCSFIWNIFLCHLVLSSFLCLWSLFCYKIVVPHASGVCFRPVVASSLSLGVDYLFDSLQSFFVNGCSAGSCDLWCFRDRRWTQVLLLCHVVSNLGRKTDVLAPLWQLMLGGTVSLEDLKCFWCCCERSAVLWVPCAPLRAVSRLWQGPSPQLLCWALTVCRVQCLGLSGKWRKEYVNQGLEHWAGWVRGFPGPPSGEDRGDMVNPGWCGKGLFALRQNKCQPRQDGAWKHALLICLEQSWHPWSTMDEALVICCR